MSEMVGILSGEKFENFRERAQKYFTCALYLADRYLTEIYFSHGKYRASYFTLLAFFSRIIPDILPLSPASLSLRRVDLFDCDPHTTPLLNWNPRDAEKEIAFRSFSFITLLLLSLSLSLSLSLCDIERTFL